MIIIWTVRREQKSSGHPSPKIALKYIRSELGPIIVFILKQKWILILSFQLYFYVAPWDSGNFYNFLHL